LPQIRNVPTSKLLMGNLRPNDRRVQLLNESLYAEMLIHTHTHKTLTLVIVVKSVCLIAVANCMSKYFYVGGLPTPPHNPVLGGQGSHSLYDPSSSVCLARKALPRA
jgi:hypothetical protein